MSHFTASEHFNINIRATLTYICVGISCILPILQLFGPGNVVALTGIRIYWRIFAIFAVIILLTIFNIYQFIQSEVKQIAEELKRNKREILRWIWRKSWRHLLQQSWDFAKEIVAPLFYLLALHIKSNFKPTLKKIGNYLAAKCKAVGVYFRTVFPVAMRRMIQDFTSGFSKHLFALWVDLKKTLQTRRLFTHVVQGIWNGTTHMLKLAKDQFKFVFANLGNKIKHSLKRNAQKIGEWALNALWEWVKSDWRKLRQLFWKYMSPRWRRWFNNTFRFMRDELHDHPEVQNRLERIRNGFRNRIVSATGIIILLLASSHFLTPISDMKALLYPNYGCECHNMSLEVDIYSVLTPGIPDNQWNALCTNLGLNNKELLEIQLRYEEDSAKKKTCLGIFAHQEEACWETVVLAVCNSPINNALLARDIATKMNVSWTLLEQLCDSRL